MAFPVIQSADLKSGAETTGTSSHTVTYCTNIRANELLLLLWGSSGTGTPTTPSGWSQAGAAGNTPFYRVWYKIADGTETGTFTVSTSLSSFATWEMLRITGWRGSTIPEAVVGSTGTSTGPDSSSLDPANWATEDTLWLAFCVYNNGTNTVTAYPSGFTTVGNPHANNSSAVGVGIASLNSAVGSVDPGAFTISASLTWRATTVAIRPALAGASTVDFTATETTNGANRKYGASVSNYAFGSTTQGSKRTGGASVVALTSSFTTQAKVTAKAASVVAPSVTETTQAKVTAKSQVVYPITITETTAGTHTALGASVIALTFDSTTAGFRFGIRFGESVLALLLGAVTNGDTAKAPIHTGRIGDVARGQISDALGDGIADAERGDIAA